MAGIEQKPTPTVEDYLGVIYTLDRDGEAAIGRKLADWLEVSAPTVTITLKRMVEQGWVVMDRSKQIYLTDKGREAAASVVRRHMLTELLLARVLGIPWSQVHAEADRMEHSLSASTADRLAELIDDPSHCPHGNPIPGHEDSTEVLVPLLEAEPGRCYVLARVHEEIERNPELMTFLEEHRLIPGAAVRVAEVMPYNETVSMQVEDAGDVVLGLNVARRLWLEPAA